MMFLKRLFHLQSELNKVADEKHQMNSEFRATERSNDVSMYSPPPTTKMTPKINLALSNFNPRFKHDNIDSVRKGAKSRRKNKSVRMGSQQSHMPTNRLEPLLKRTLNKKTADQRIDSSEERRLNDPIALTGSRISKPQAQDTL